jgi:hypothetical protein
MAQPVKLRVKQLSCCEKNFLTVSSHAMVIRIGHRGRVIWHRATSFFGGLWNLVSMPTNHKQFLSSRQRFDVSLAKLSCNYAEMSSRISSKEQECASRVVGNIYQILSSTVNRSMCTLYWNKNISTFWLNGAFYYKIKSCALVGTPYIYIYFCNANFVKYLCCTLSADWGTFSSHYIKALALPFIIILMVSELWHCIWDPNTSHKDC